MCMDGYSLTRVVRSGVLQPLLGQPDAIRRVLDAELSKLQLRGDLYLPTNPDVRVVG